jgi:hypothetical protein
MKLNNLILGLSAIVIASCTSIPDQLGLKKVDDGKYIVDENKLDTDWMKKEFNLKEYEISDGYGHRKGFYFNGKFNSRDCEIVTTNLENLIKNNYTNFIYDLPKGWHAISY